MIHQKKKTEYVNKVKKLNSELSERAEEIIGVGMPEKILELTELYNSIPRSYQSLKKYSGPDGMRVDSSVAETTISINKKRKTVSEEAHNTALSREPDGTKPTKNLFDYMEIVKKELVDMTEMLNTVKIWIQLNVPRIEDGNNFGVSIQEQTIAELERAESDAYSVMESITKFYLSHAKISTKMLKYPQVNAYQRSLYELEEEQFQNVRLCSLDIRNNYNVLYDLIHKNLEKLRFPRTSHASSLF